MKEVSFTEMAKGTAADYAMLDTYEKQHISTLPDQILESLTALESGLSGYQIDRLTHCLQTATRAEKDGADVDMIVAALIHDIGDGLAPQNHSQLAAAIIRPYVRAEVTWVVEMHGVFQMFYYAHHLGQDQHARERYRDHQWFDSCARFCERWDQTSFDPDYPTRTLLHFEPMVRQVFSRPAFDPDIIGNDQLK